MYNITVIFCTNYRNLKHPNIVQLHGYAISGDELVLVMNYVDGYNLEKILFGKGTNIEVNILYKNTVILICEYNVSFPSSCHPTWL